MDQSIALLFDLIKIPSPSGQELAIGTYIKTHLKSLGIISEFDQSGEKNDSNSGNLIAKVSGVPHLPTVLFVAHMDTVEVGDVSIEPQIHNGIISSNGNTILGADNKVAVYCLLQTLKEVQTWHKRPNIVAVFSTREENGEMGIRHLKLKDHVDFCINIEAPGNLGDFVYQTLGELPFEIIIHGKAAHAAMEPERGVNAIKIASKFITKLRLGKYKNGIVVNIGKMYGGTANNVVPDTVSIQGQVRAFNQKTIDITLEKIQKLLKKECSQDGATYDFTIYPQLGAPPANISLNHPIVNLVKRASSVVGIPCSLSKVSFGSDANFLSTNYPTLTFCMGGKNAHSTDETIHMDSIKRSEMLLLEIVRQLCSK